MKSVIKTLPDDPAAPGSRLMNQMNFSNVEQAGNRKQTWRRCFLTKTKQAAPWVGLLAPIKRFYPVEVNGRPPYPLEIMLHIHLLQNWFALNDPARGSAV